MNQIRVNPQAEIQRRTITGEHDCIIVDDFLQDPHSIVEFASQHAGEFSMPKIGNYPGPQFRLEGKAMEDVYRFIRARMSRHFRFFRGDMGMWTVLSMATTQPDELSAFQRLCHTDPNPHPEREIYAALVYLFENEDFGGTGFYRLKEPELFHNATAIEREEPGKALAFLQEHFPTYRKPACYMTGSNEIAENLCTISARFNRLIFYSGRVPHNAEITAPELLTDDPRKGRLTLNVFASVLPK
jgi:hypothetical protein